MKLFLYRIMRHSHNIMRPSLGWEKVDRGCGMDFGEDDIGGHEISSENSHADFS